MNSPQKKIYETVGKPCLEKVLEGYNTSVIVLGEKGAGKTYTTIGIKAKTQIPNTTQQQTTSTQNTNTKTVPTVNENAFNYLNEDHEENGLIPNFIKQLFLSIRKLSEQNCKITVSLSVYEIINDDDGNLVNDLLNFENNQQKDLEILIHEESSEIELSGLNEIVINSDKHLILLFEKAIKFKNENSTLFFELLINQEFTKEKIKKNSRFTIIDYEKNEKTNVFENICKNLFEENNKYNYFQNSESALLYGRTFTNCITTTVLCCNPQIEMAEKAKETLDLLN